MKFARQMLVLVAYASVVLTPAHAQDKEYVVGSSATYRPFAFETPNKEITGYDIDMIKAIAQNAGFRVRIVNTPWTGIFAALNNGDVDLIISGVTINDKRKQSYDFSMPYFEARQLIAVPTTSSTIRPTMPSLMVTPANPDAIPVANGLMVEPSTPMPQPRSRMDAPSSES